MTLVRKTPEPVLTKFFQKKHAFLCRAVSDVTQVDVNLKTVKFLINRSTRWQVTALQNYLSIDSLSKC